MRNIDFDFHKNINSTRKDTGISNGCVLTVGCFDGVHLGHAALVSELVCLSLRLSLPSAVLTFFADDRPKAEVKHLASPEASEARLFSLGVDYLLRCGYGSLREMEPREFVDEIVCGALNAKAVVCGEDFHFGRECAGDADMLVRLCADRGTECTVLPDYIINGMKVSSSAIRRCIASGNLEKANEMLGYDYSFRSVVKSGKKLGRRLGIPTINQSFPESLAPLRFGVYAVKCVLNGATYGGVANVGVNPTFGAIDAPVCETHLFGFDGDAYGLEAEISFLSFIRDEKRFSSQEELGRQALSDSETAKIILDERGVTEK